jgi:hypothetical protein
MLPPRQLLLVTRRLGIAREDVREGRVGSGPMDERKLRRQAPVSQPHNHLHLDHHGGTADYPAFGDASMPSKVRALWDAGSGERDASRSPIRRERPAAGSPAGRRRAPAHKVMSRASWW